MYLLVRQTLVTCREAPGAVGQRCTRPPRLVAISQGGHTSNNGGHTNDEEH